MSMARASSGLADPHRFYAAATYAGFGGSPNSSSKGVTSKFSNDVALLLYALYQQQRWKVAFQALEKAASLGIYVGTQVGVQVGVAAAVSLCSIL